MCSPHKALIITPFFRPNIGGAETFAEDLAKVISKEYLIHICTIKWSKPIIWSGMDYWRAFKLLCRLTLPLLKMLKNNKYDKIYALGLIPSLLCSALHLKFYSVILALYDFDKPNLFGKILNSAQKVFVEGFKGERDMLNVGVKKEKIVKFNHWVDQTAFHYEQRKNKKLRVLFVGRPIRIKGKHIIEECENLTNGIDYEYVENVPYAELPQHYQMADVVVVPSLYSEGFSRVVVEAASCGCIVIASNRGSLPELVKDFGFCIDPTPEKFSKILINLKHNPTTVEDKQVKTALYAHEHFGEKNADCFLRG